MVAPGTVCKVQWHDMAKDEILPESKSLQERIPYLFLHSQKTGPIWGPFGVCVTLKSSFFPWKITYTDVPKPDIARMTLQCHPLSGFSSMKPKRTKRLFASSEHKLWNYVFFYTELTLEQYGFELLGSAYTQIFFFSKYIGKTFGDL